MKQYNQTNSSEINYKIGDKIVSKMFPNKEIGICTGFIDNDTCILIDGKCFGGKEFFMKSEFTDFEIIN